jgi:hypothetical protein
MVLLAVCRVAAVSNKVACGNAVVFQAALYGACDWLCKESVVLWGR